MPWCGRAGVGVGDRCKPDGPDNHRSHRGVSHLSRYHMKRVSHLVNLHNRCYFWGPSGFSETISSKFLTNSYQTACAKLAEKGKSDRFHVCLNWSAYLRVKSNCSESIFCQILFIIIYIVATLIWGILVLSTGKVKHSQKFYYDHVKFHREMICFNFWLVRSSSTS